MSIRCAQIAEAFPDLFPRTLGALQTIVDRAASPGQAGPGALVFAGDEAALRQALEAKAGAIILPLKLEALLPGELPGCCLFTSRVKMAMALVLGRFFDDTREHFRQDPAIDPRSHVSPEALVGPGVIVAAGAYVGARAVLGEGAIIGPGCVVEAEAQVGAGSILHALVFLGRRCRVGDRCQIHPHTTIGADGFSYAQDAAGHHHKIPQLGIVIIEDDVEIQANCAIDRAAFDATRIGRGTKLDNLCHIAHNCQIGQHVLLTGGFMVAGSSTLGDHCVTGGRTTVTDHVHLCGGVQLAGLSAVTKNITEPGVYAGHPLQPLKAFLRTTASLVHLPGIRKRLADLEQQVGKAAPGL